MGAEDDVQEQGEGGRYGVCAWGASAPEEVAEDERFTGASGMDGMGWFHSFESVGWRGVGARTRYRMTCRSLRRLKAEQFYVHVEQRVEGGPADAREHVDGEQGTQAEKEGEGDGNDSGGGVVFATVYLQGGDQNGQDRDQEQRDNDGADDEGAEAVDPCGRPAGRRAYMSQARRLRRAERDKGACEIGVGKDTQDGLFNRVVGRRRGRRDRGNHRTGKKYCGRSERGYRYGIVVICIGHNFYAEPKQPGWCRGWPERGWRRGRGGGYRCLCRRGSRRSPGISEAPGRSEVPVVTGMGGLLVVGALWLAGGAAKCK